MDTKNHKGFTLLEVLITLVILSIGLLGLAGLQATGLKNNHSAFLSSQATLMAYDMLDRIRANQEGVNTGSYNNLSGTSSSIDCESGNCDAVEMAQFDDYQWGQRLTTLPTGKGKVSGTGPASQFTVTVMWDDARTGATGTDCGNDPTVDLRCITISAIP